MCHPAIGAGRDIPTDEFAAARAEQSVVAGLIHKGNGKLPFINCKRMPAFLPCIIGVSDPEMRIF
jgi:hypothetical protein